MALARLRRVGQRAGMRPVQVPGMQPEVAPQRSSPSFRHSDVLVITAFGGDSGTSGMLEFRVLACDIDGPKASSKTLHRASFRNDPRYRRVQAEDGQHRVNCLRSIDIARKLVGPGAERRPIALAVASNALTPTARHDFAWGGLAFPALSVCRHVQACAWWREDCTRA